MSHVIQFITRWFKRLFFLFLIVLLVMATPVASIEYLCRTDAGAPSSAQVITEEKFRRPEANSYLTYPEWHIVYAYEGLAKSLQKGDEHEFGYRQSIAGFWTSFCALNRKASSRGGADFPTRMTLHIIGQSFTFEMAMKAAYEETIGRFFAARRGAEKSAQDVYAAQVATDYAQFLQQKPWYQFDFEKSVDDLWNLPLENFVRGWERRLALGGEWKAKAAYARLIAGSVESTGAAQVRIRTVVAGLDAIQLATMGDVDIVANKPDHVVIDTPRYRAFTRILENILRADGRVLEIAGNRSIMLSVLEPKSRAAWPVTVGELIARIPRDSFPQNRLLVAVDLSDLEAFMLNLRVSGRRLEHFYDY